MKEIADPERSLVRAQENCQKFGCSEKCLPAYYIIFMEWSGGDSAKNIPVRKIKAKGEINLE